MCGAALPPKAPEGLCPKCLLAGVAAPTETGSGNPPRFQPPPSREALELAFPQLEILELIGQGGMGAVFKARQPKLNRFVALKILPESLGRDPKFAERFSREGQLLARLNHPNVVTIHDFGQAGGFFYLLMEFVDGVNLRQAMRAGRFTAAQALGIVPKICEALQYAHDEGVLHRDIKPENILLDTKGRVKLADFGIAKFIGDVEAADLAASNAAPDAAAVPPQLTSASAALGTPNYMAPEQREHPTEVDHRADIYSLGVVFYEMLTGELPQGKFAVPSAKTPLDPRVDEVVLRALEHERERRQQSAGEIKTQVETIASSSSDSRREAAQTSGLPPRFLKVCTSTLSTPEQLATLEGQFFQFRTRGQLILDDRHLTHSRAGTNTVIPLAAIRDLSIGHYPRTMNPVGLDLISVIYEEDGQRKQLLLSPMEGFFGLPATWNARVVEWFHAIRDAIIAATGHVPGNTPAERLGVPSGSKMIYAFLLIPFLFPLLLGGLALRQLMAVHPDGGSGGLLQTPLAQLLIIFVLSSGAIAALGGSWVLRQRRKTVNAVTGRAPGNTPAERLSVPHGFKAIFAVLLAALNGLIGWLWWEGTKLYLDFFVSVENLANPNVHNWRKPLQALLVEHQLWVVFGLTLASGGLLSFLIIRRVRLAANRASSVSTPVAPNQGASGLRFGVLLMILLPFAAFVSIWVLSRFEAGMAPPMPVIMEPAPAQPPPMEPPRIAPNAGVISKVRTEKGKATIEAQLDRQQELRVFVGEESLGWSVPAPKAGGAVTLVVEASNQIRLADGSLGVGLIMQSGGSTTFVAMTPGGPVPFGELEFRENRNITDEGGTYTFADIRKADGTLVPVSVKVRNKSAASAAAPKARATGAQAGRDLLAALQSDLAALRVSHVEQHPDVKALRARIAAVEASLAKGEETSLAQLRGELAAMSQTYGEQHPRIKELRARIAALERFGKSVK